MTRFAMLPARAIGARLSGRAWSVLTAIALHADPAGYAYPSLATIAGLTAIARGDLPKIVRELTGAGLLQVTPGGHRSRGKPSNLYRVVMDATVCSATDSATATVCPGTVSAETDSAATVCSATVSPGAAATVCPGADLTDQRNIKEDSLPAGEARARRSKLRSSISVDWEPDGIDVDHAIGRGVSREQIAHEAEKFRDHHLKHGNLYADWRAAWRTWVSRIDEFARKPGRPSQPPGSLPEFALAGKDAADRLEARGI